MVLTDDDDDDSEEGWHCCQMKSDLVCVSADTMMSFSRTSVDHSRVKVTLKTSNQDTDYINANFIKVLKTSSAALWPFLSQHARMNAKTYISAVVVTLHSEAVLLSSVLN